MCTPFRSLDSSLFVSTFQGVKAGCGSTYFGIDSCLRRDVQSWEQQSKRSCRSCCQSGEEHDGEVSRRQRRSLPGPSEPPKDSSVCPHKPCSTPDGKKDQTLLPPRSTSWSLQPRSKVMFKVITFFNCHNSEINQLQEKILGSTPMFLTIGNYILYFLNVSSSSFNQKSCMTFKMASFIASFHHYIELFHSQDSRSNS